MFIMMLLQIFSCLDYLHSGMNVDTILLGQHNLKIKYHTVTGSSKKKQGKIESADSTSHIITHSAPVISPGPSGTEAMIPVTQ